MLELRRRALQPADRVGQEVEPALRVDTRAQPQRRADIAGGTPAARELELLGGQGTGLVVLTAALRGLRGRRAPRGPRRVELRRQDLVAERLRLLVRPLR